MKITVNNNADCQKSFPKLMILKSTGAIILATKYGTGSDSNRPYGTIIKKGDTYEVGEIGYWSSKFVDFEGSVTLSND